MRTSLATITAAVTGLALALTGCAQTTSPEVPTAVSASPETPVASDGDITNAILTRTDPNCSAYVGDYSATVTDINEATQFTSALAIEVSGDHCTLVSNNIPNHDFDDESAHFATQVVEVNREFSIPASPVLAAESTPLSQQSYNGVMLNGVPLDIVSAGCYRPQSPMANDQGIVPIGCTPNDAWLANPLGSADTFGADSHNAHVQPDGGYHYHGTPNALFDDSPGAEGSPVIGFAADGFPIYGSYFADPSTGEVREVISGYELQTGARPSGASNPPGDYDGTYYDDYAFTGNGDLDECNGAMIDGQYRYYATDSFPYLPYCLVGTADGSFSKR